MRINPITAVDFYKCGHIFQYPKNMTAIKGHVVARGFANNDLYRSLLGDHVLFFGAQYFAMDFLVDTWNKNFFNLDKHTAVNFYKRRVQTSLGCDFDIKAIEKLHDLQYLPVEVRAIPEGSLVPVGMPLLTIQNTHDDFFWLPTFLETAIMSYLWKPISSATKAFALKRLMKAFAMNTGSDLDFLNVQAHDFSFRASSNIQDGCTVGACHLLCFTGTDTVSGIDFLEKFYGANADQEMIGCSIPATEHSVHIAWDKDNEKNLIKSLITEIYPTGLLSIVSDTWDFWRVLSEYIKDLKQIILNRDGKVVIRPDSGDPYKVIVGDKGKPLGSCEHKGTVEYLWDEFGGTTNEKGYKVLDPHIGVIFGDAVDLDVVNIVLRGLESKGFASSNVVFGVGGSMYQKSTRDELGLTFNAHSCVVEGELMAISKNPATSGAGFKKSIAGDFDIYLDKNGNACIRQDTSNIGEGDSILKTIFKNGNLTTPTTLNSIRRLIDRYI